MSQVKFERHNDDQILTFECQFVVKDVSPMISYSDGWVDSNPTDPLLGNYTNSTFHATQTAVSTVEHGGYQI